MSQENVENVRGVRYRVSLPSEGASQRRSLDDRLFVRFPALFRLLADPRGGCRHDLGFGGC